VGGTHHTLISSAICGTVGASRAHSTVDAAVTCRTAAVGSGGGPHWAGKPCTPTAGACILGEPYGEGAGWAKLAVLRAAVSWGAVTSITHAVSLRGCIGAARHACWTRDWPRSRLASRAEGARGARTALRPSKARLASCTGHEAAT
jgi:hypothetical protein